MQLVVQNQSTQTVKSNEHDQPQDTFVTFTKPRD